MIALIAALAKLSNSGPAFAVASFYISFFRGVPLLMQVYLVYLGLPQLGFVVDAIPAGVAALSLCYGAYMAEIFRAGILAVPQGQARSRCCFGLEIDPDHAQNRLATSDETHRASYRESIHRYAERQLARCPSSASGN